MHYRLYEIPSHLYIPSFVSDPERELRNKGHCGRMEVEMRERTEERERERERSQPKRKARSASFLKTIRARMRFTLLPSKVQMWQRRESLVRAGLIKNRLSTTTNQTTQTRRKVDTLHIKAGQGENKACGNMKS